MNTVKIRDIEIGAGAPKIIVPIVGVTKEDIIEEAKTFDSIPIDVVEWRVDWFEGCLLYTSFRESLSTSNASWITSSPFLSYARLCVVGDCV